MNSGIEKLRDKSWRMNHLYKIKTKNQLLSTYKRNKAQTDYATNKTGRDIILKARQIGFSTEGLIDLFDETITHRNTNSAIIAHERQKVQVLFEIVRRAYDNMPPELRPKVSFDNRNELYFPDLDSKIYVTLDTRGETVHNLHVSELAFVRDADNRMAAILASVPKNGKISFESTANGMQGYYFDEWMNDLSGFTKHFYNWTWLDDYQIETTRSLDELQTEYHLLASKYGTIEDIYSRFELTIPQFNWYIETLKQQKHMMRQEYPTTDIEAFVSSGRNIFHSEDLSAHPASEPIDYKYSDAKIWEHPLVGFKYVMGVDTSEGFGGDRSVICILNAATGEQVAEFASNRVEPSELGGYIIELGKYYNNAYAVVEYNNTGIATIDSIKRIYPNLYRREQYDKVSKSISEAIGWRTTGTTKPLLISNLEEAIRTQSIFVRSKECLKELSTFVRTDEQNKQGYGAEGSNHDDRVIALGLAVQGIKNLPAMRAPKSIAQKQLEQFIEFQKNPEMNARPVMSLHPHSSKRNYKIRGMTR